jgi:hypothetical protein
LSQKFGIGFDEKNIKSAHHGMRKATALEAPTRNKPFCRIAPQYRAFLLERLEAV